ncbi:hypothetical protein SLS56_001538 [Neofusicoccum ribis]|uniref:ATP-dependent DNA ligase family profile domain-containing protein n=1 Tax=Neofusicoccum ribis TaxID=45134 RepID=A0ABR3T8G2_9PEZI
MPLRFTWICDLLRDIEDIECRDPPHLPDRKRRLLRIAVENWFRKHRKNLDRPDTNGAAILSTLLPHTRTDRVYGLQAPRLTTLVARCLRFGTEKVKELNGWKDPTRGDLGACLERIEKEFDCEPLPGPGILSVEEVDRGLCDIASRCRFSSPAVQKTVSADVPQQILEPLMFRMHSREKKWFVRLLLKDFGRAVLDEALVLAEFHFMLPPLLKFQNDFATAIALLKGPLACYHAKPDPLSQKLMLEQAAQHLKPKIGIKIGRPTWYKARSFRNCLQMVGDGTWIIERKYDGEFCEVHVDLTKEDNIQIFSKNGKDATNDRRNLLPAIRGSLKIGTAECRIKSKCILLGEMVVFNQLDNQVMDFDKIRKHVSRSGSFLGTDKDSQPHPYENLMIFFFDILLVDEEVTMTLPHLKRRKRLSEVITKIYGRAMTVEWKQLDFSTAEAKKSLIYQFAYALHYRCEGLILKPNAPFFSLARDETASWCKGFIKLKQDYMTDMGGARDVADFAVVAASHDVQQAQRCRQRNLRWTNFYLGCLVGDDNGTHRGRSKFKIVAVVKATHCIPPKELEFLNQIGQFHCKEFDEDEPFTEDFTIQLGKNPIPGVLFTSPLVVEVLGSSFEKPPNEDFHMLRHPRVLRTHTDRSWKDCITMQGLADMAREAKEAPPDGESQDIKNKVQSYMEKINRSQDRNSLASKQTTPRSAGTTHSVSPLATLKTVNPAYAAGTPNPTSVLRPSGAHHNSAPSTASIKTPSPATALMKAKRTTIHTSITVDFAKEVTPVSQPSMQWTDTIGTPAASGPPTMREPLSTISPPKRNIVSDKSNGKAIRLFSRSEEEPLTRASVEDSPCPEVQNTIGLREARPDASGHGVSETLRTATGEPGNAQNVSIACENSPELSFYEEREASSMKQLTTRLRKEPHSKTASSGPGNSLRTNVQPCPPPNGRFAGRSGATFAQSSTAVVLKGPSDRISQQKEGAVDVLIRARTSTAAVAAVISPENTISSVRKLYSQEESPSATAYMLPPIPMLNGHPLPTPPKSSPNEPLSKHNAQPQNIPPAPPTRRLPTTNNPKRAADDFDIDASPRKVPKWRSSVYGLPSLPKPNNNNNHATNTLGPQPQPTRSELASSLPLPYTLPRTCFYLAFSLRHHTRLRHDLLARHFDAVVVDDLEHWRRDDAVYESMGSTVGESQAYYGYAKVVLVEPGKKRECEVVVVRVRDVLGRREEGVGVFDWRVVEDLVEAEAEGRRGEEREREIWEGRVWSLV